MKLKKTKKHSIVIRIFLLLIVVIFLQAMFSLYTVIITDIATTVESYSYNTFTRTVINRKSNLENFMTTGWSNISEISTTISDLYVEMVGEEGELTEDEKMLFLKNSIPSVMQMITKGGTTGGFLILDDGENMAYNYSSVYLKRTGNLNQVLSSENITLACGPTQVSKEYGFPLESSWSYGFKLTEENIDILEKPMMATESTKSLEYLGYWHISNDITDKNAQILTYTMPIFDQYYNPIGVIGVEITESYLYNFLPEDEFGSGSYGYFLADIVDDTGGYIAPLTLNGSSQKNLLSLGNPVEIKELSLGNHVLEAIPKLIYEKDTDICVYYETLNLYVRNSPYEGQNIWIVGMVNLDAMTAFTNAFWHSMMIMVIGSIIAGTVVSYIVGRLVAKPILKLSTAVSQYDIQQKFTFEESNIKEIAELSGLIVQMQENILRSANRTDKILELLDFGVGSFEYEKNSNVVSVSQAVYKMLGMEEYEGKPILKDIFFDKLNVLKSNPIKEAENTYAVGENVINYYKVVEFQQEDTLLGVIEDATSDIEYLLVLNYERNYDVLTGIFNRRAFNQKVVDVMKNADLKIAGFVMFDLDNLKYVNDTFGHDSGDVYIKTAATMINSSLSKNGVVGRMSGDEFYAFLYGFDSKELLMKELNDFYARFDEEPIEMPNKVKFKIRISGGIAWYGDDSCDLEELKTYADFAMYKGKHTVKGELRQFNKDDYNAESFMLSGKEELHKILDDEMINFVYQPIIEAKTGKIYGYEAFMRPKSEVLTSPLKFLKIASLEGKLNKVDKIVLYKALESYNEFKEELKDAKLFINSMPNEILKDEEYAELKEKYKTNLENIVVEIVEQEQLSEEIITKKLEKLKLIEVNIALDDYGSGYVNDMALIKIKPNIVKIDRSIISNIHVDPSKQSILQKITVFCKEHDIDILAKGVETEQELEYLLNIGVDMLQGYYISRPIEKPQFDDNDISQKILELRK